VGRHILHGECVGVGLPGHNLAICDEYYDCAANKSLLAFNYLAFSASF
jgi:hypothetical protein